MSNELLLLVIAIADIAFVGFAAWRGIAWLYGSIAINLALVSIFGSNLISVLGMETNAGNVFYACVFLATHFIVEKYGKREGLKTIFYGVNFILFFVVMSQLASRLNGSSEYSYSLRIALASMLGYLFAQYINISVYEWLKTLTRGKFLWLRTNGANILGQLADSLIFFSIAFFDLPGSALIQAMLAGWIIKTLTVVLATPFLYLSLYIQKKIA